MTQIRKTADYSGLALSKKRLVKAGTRLVLMECQKVKSNSERACAKTREGLQAILQTVDSVSLELKGRMIIAEASRMVIFHLLYGK